MALYCSTEMFRGLSGAKFPASRDELLEYAKQHDAPEAAVVVLNQLEDVRFEDISDVCRNAGVACSVETAKVLADAQFPATKEDLIALATEREAPRSVMMALDALPDGVPFGSVGDVCTEIT